MTRFLSGMAAALAMSAALVAWPAGAEYQREKCWFPPSKYTAVQCGRLHIKDPVPVSLPVVVVQDDPSGPSETAILFLQGGPGGSSGLERYQFGWDQWADQAALNQDLVVYDQRGTGLAKPSLHCREIRDASRESLGLGWFSDAAIALNAEATAECHRRLVSEGHELAQYSTQRNAEDVIALMEELPYSRWTLLGTSYGARLALEVMRKRPEGLDSVVLDGVVPPDIDWRAEIPVLLDDAIAKIDGVCSWWDMQEPTCSRQAGEFIGSLDTVLAQLAVTPRSISAGEWQSSATIEVQVDAPTLLDALGSVLRSRDGANLARDAINQAALGQFTVLDGVLEGWANGHLRDDIHEPVFLSVWCDIGGDSIDEALSRSVASSRYYRAHYPQPAFVNPCGYWTSSRAPDVSRRPLASSIPTLILSGEYDPITPAEWGQRVADGLDNSVHFVMPRGGHVVIFEDRCAMRIMAEFLADPTTAPRAACLEDRVVGVRDR